MNPIYDEFGHCINQNQLAVDAYDQHMQHQPEPIAIKCPICGCETRIVKTKIVEAHRDSTEIYKLECGHWVM